MYKRLLPEMLPRTVSLAKQVSSCPRKRFDSHEGAYSLPSLQRRHKAKVAAASKALQQHQKVLENTLQSSYGTEVVKGYAIAFAILLTLHLLSFTSCGCGCSGSCVVVMVVVTIITMIMEVVTLIKICIKHQQSHCCISHLSHAHLQLIVMHSTYRTLCHMIQALGW